MKAYLKIKIKSLAEESRMIRSAERKLNLNARGRQRLARAINIGINHNTNGGDGVALPDHERARLEKKLARSRARLANPKVMAVRNGFRTHRLELRGYARSAHLAYGFLREVPYSVMEQNARHSPNWADIARMIEKFSEEGFQFWESRFIEFKESSGFFVKA